MPPCARRQTGEPDGSDTDPDQSGDRVAERGHHAAYLPVAAFIDGQLHFPLPGPVGILFAPEQAHILGRPGHPVVEHDAAPEPSERVFAGNTGDGHPVGLRDMVARMGQLKEKIAVVGQEDQAFTVGVQSPDRAQHGLAADVH